MAIIDQQITDRYAAYNADCCEVLPQLKDDSIDLSIYSPPFAELYNYSSSDRDMSNCRSYEQFLEHYSFLVAHLARVTKPGRLSCVHCMELKGPNSSQVDFPGDIIRLHQRHGFLYHGRHTIWREPLRVAIRTRSLRLMHRQLIKDSSLSGCAGADYLLVFRKDGENQTQITHGSGFTRYAGDMIPPAEIQTKYKGWTDPKTNKLSHWIWQRYASSVWMDIRVGRVLPYREARGSDEEKHICPLQLDVIERCVELWSNPGEVVLTPFLGVGSEAYGALIHGRKAVGVELKPTYYRQALANIKAALTTSLEQDDLFSGVMEDHEPAEDEIEAEEAQPT